MKSKPLLFESCERFVDAAEQYFIARCLFNFIGNGNTVRIVPNADDRQHHHQFEITQAWGTVSFNQDSRINVLRGQARPLARQVKIGGHVAIDPSGDCVDANIHESARVWRVSYAANLMSFRLKSSAASSEATISPPALDKRAKSERGISC